MSTANSDYIAKGLVFLLDPATLENIYTPGTGFPTGTASLTGGTAVTAGTASFGPAAIFTGSNQKLEWLQDGSVANDSLFGGGVTGKSITFVAHAEYSGALSERRVLSFIGTDGDPYSIFSIEATATKWKFQTRNKAGVQVNIEGPNVVAGTPVRMVARMKDTGALDFWVNGTLYTTATLQTGLILTRQLLVGAYTGNLQVFSGGIGACAVFNDDLSDADCLSLSNDVSQLYAAAGSPPAGTVTISAVDPGETTAEVTYSYDDTDETGFEYRIDGGTAASIGASPATITGLTAATEYDIEVRAINASGAGAWSAVSTFTTDEAPPGNTAPTFDGPNIDAISGTEGVALSALDVSGLFSDAESSLTFSAVGSWPAGVTVSSAGVISGTPTTAGTYASLTVRATDAGALTVDSNAFSIVVAAPSAYGTITVGSALYPIRTAGGSPMNESGVRVCVLNATTMAPVYNAAGHTIVDGIMTISEDGIVAGTAYHVATKIGSDWIGMSDAVIAT